MDSVSQDTPPATQSRTLLGPFHQVGVLLDSFGIIGLTVAAFARMFDFFPFASHAFDVLLFGVASLPLIASFLLRQYAFRRIAYLMGWAYVVAVVIPLSRLFTVRDSLAPHPEYLTRLWGAGILLSIPVAYLAYAMVYSRKYFWNAAAIRALPLKPAITILGILILLMLGLMYYVSLIFQAYPFD